ncbi:hypothetical protein AgCh_038447 [Apium graveolens]
MGTLIVSYQLWICVFGGPEVGSSGSDGMLKTFLECSVPEARDQVLSNLEEIIVALIVIFPHIHIYVRKIVETGSGSGGTASIDLTIYHFPQPIDLSEKAESVKAYALWAEKGGVARETILVALENTLFDIYSSDAYTTKVLWDKLDQTHNTDSRGLEKYYVTRFLDFKLVDGKSMTEQVHEFEMFVHALGESDMVLIEKFRVMSVIEKLPKSWEEFALSLKRQKGEITWTNLILDIFVGHLSKDCPSKKAKKAGVVAQANTVLGLGITSGFVANKVIGEVVASRTYDGMANPLYIQILKNGPITPMVRVEESTDGDIPSHYAPKDPSEYTGCVGGARTPGSSSPATPDFPATGTAKLQFSPCSFEDGEV